MRYFFIAKITFSYLIFQVLSCTLVEFRRLVERIRETDTET